MGRSHSARSLSSCSDFGSGDRVSRHNGRAAGGARGDFMFDRDFSRRAFFSQRFQNFFKKPLGAPRVRQHRGPFFERKRVRAKRLDGKSHPVEFRKIRANAFGLAGADIQHERRQ